MAYALVVVLAGSTIYYWPKASPKIQKKTEDIEVVPEYRARLFTEQEAVYRGRYAMTEARRDISNGKPKLLLSGFPRKFEEEWRSIMKERFGVQTEFIAGCESSALLANYVGAYNAVIERHIFSKFGAHALEESLEDAKRIHEEKN